MPIVAEIVSGLKGRKCGKGWLARCPAHADSNASLSIRESGDKVLVHCFTGCEQSSVIAALRDIGLWPEPSKARTSHPTERDPDWPADLRAAEHWRVSSLLMADAALEQMRTTDPERLSLT